jgi:hypothetical protein
MCHIYMLAHTLVVSCKPGRTDGLTQVLTLLGLAFWLVNVSVTGYHAWLNVKPLFLFIISMFSRLSVASYTRLSVYSCHLVARPYKRKAVSLNFCTVETSSCAFFQFFIYLWKISFDITYILHFLMYVAFKNRIDLPGYSTFTNMCYAEFSFCNSYCAM